MSGEAVKTRTKRLKDLAPLFRDQAACSRMNPESDIYRVCWWSPASPAEEGALLWGATIVEPGKVGDEYFMTHGHYHANPTRAEYYGTVSGTGMLLRMDASRHTWAELMTPGGLHYIRGEHGHRVANTGDVPLVFWACWPSDAGYEYGDIAEKGFGARVVARDGQAMLEGGE